MNTPDSPGSSMMSGSARPEMTPEQFTSYVNEKFSDAFRADQEHEGDNQNTNDDLDDLQSIKFNINHFKVYFTAVFRRQVLVTYFTSPDRCNVSFNITPICCVDSDTNLIRNARGDNRADS